MLERRGVSIFCVITVWSQHAYTFRVKGNSAHPVSLSSLRHPHFSAMAYKDLTLI